MSNEKQIKQWRKYRRRSIQAFPVAVGLFLLVSGGLFLATRIVSVPPWLEIVLVSVLAFSVIGDAINIVYLGQKLKSEADKNR